MWGSAHQRTPCTFVHVARVRVLRGATRKRRQSKPTCSARRDAKVRGCVILELSAKGADWRSLGGHDVYSTRQHAGLAHLDTVNCADSFCAHIPGRGMQKGARCCEVHECDCVGERTPPQRSCSARSLSSNKDVHSRRNRARKAQRAAHRRRTCAEVHTENRSLSHLSWHAASLATQGSQQLCD